MLQSCGKVCLQNFKNLSFIHHILVRVIMLLLLLLYPHRSSIPCSKLISSLNHFHLSLFTSWCLFSGLVTWLQHFILCIFIIVASPFIFLSRHQLYGLLVFSLSENIPSLGLLFAWLVHARSIRSLILHIIINRI